MCASWAPRAVAGFGMVGARGRPVRWVDLTGFALVGGRGRLVGAPCVAAGSWLTLHSLHHISYTTSVIPHSLHRIAYAA